ncbi:MAG: ABC transporter permease [Anaerolineales bacterium]
MPPDLILTTQHYKPVSHSQMVMRSFLRNRSALLGLLILATFVILALLAPWIAPYDPAIIDLAGRLAGPSPQHWLGTDELGRDILTRILIGSRITLVITMLAVLLALVAGGVMGVIAGLFGGTTDFITSMFIDLLMTMPGFLLAIGIVSVLGVGTRNVILAVGIASIPAFARIARGSTMAVKALPYVMAAKALGVSRTSIMLHHIAPNIASPLTVQTSLRLATAILTASSLSFLGLGTQPPTPEWGAMLSTGRNFLNSAPLLVLFPGVAILLVTLSFNLIGDGLRDAIDPHVRGRP